MRFSPVVVLEIACAACLSCREGQMKQQIQIQNLFQGVKQYLASLWGPPDTEDPGSSITGWAVMTVPDSPGVQRTFVECHTPLSPVRLFTVNIQPRKYWSFIMSCGHVETFVYIQERESRCTDELGLVLRCSTC